MDPKYTLVFETDPMNLTETEVAAVIAMTAQLTTLNLPGYDPTDVTLTMKFGRTAHSATARMRLPEGKPAT